MMKINLIGKNVQMKKKTVILLAVVGILFFSVIGYLISTANNNNVTVEFDPLSTNEITAPETSDAIPEDISKKQMIQVYVTGCVVNPGIYELEKGQIIHNAILKAGGLTKEADKNINLVYKLYENVTLYVRSETETNRQFHSTGIEIIKGDTGAIVGQDQQPSQESGSLVNINTANASLLTSLPGVGDATAANIISYRENNGNFQKIEDIMNVPGIKENKFNQIKNHITVD